MDRTGFEEGLRRAAELERAGQLDSAASELERALRFPVETAVSRVRAHLALGRLYDRLGRRREAQSCYRRVLALTDDVRFRSEARRRYRHAYSAHPGTER